MVRWLEGSKRKADRPGGARSEAPGSAETSDASIEEVRRRLGDLTLVNVLPSAAFEEERIPGSISLPVEEIRACAAQVLPDPAMEIVVYCGGPT